MKSTFIVILLFVNMLFTMSYAQKKEVLYVGTFSERDSKGIYVYEFNREELSFSLIQTTGGKVSPSFIDVDPKKNYLFSVNRTGVGDHKDWGSVTSYKINRKNGKLSKINSVSAFGREPCHIIIDKSGTRALVSNYSTGNLIMFPISNTGILSEEALSIQHNGSSINQSRQKGPHVHSVKISSDNRFVYASDLGLDKVMIYEMDAEMGSLKAATIPYAKTEPGSGPRHFACHPTKPFAYVIEEMGNTVTAFSINIQNGSLERLQVISTLPDQFNDVSYCADIHVHPNGKFLYGSNRGHNSITIFSIDDKSGKLTTVGYVSTKGDWPRNFMIDDSGQLLLVANQKSDNIAVFEIDQSTGQLKDTGVEINNPAPVCLKIITLD